jgi:hypothetical protein
MILLLASLIACAVGVVTVAQAKPKAAPTLCGTPTVNLTLLSSPVDYLIPAGSSCSAPECGSGKRLPWDLYVNVCVAVKMTTRNCQGSAVCQTWPGDSASLGQFSQTNFTDIPGGVAMTATGGSVAQGIARSVVLTIMCVPPAMAEPIPTFMSEDPNALQYRLSWGRPEACPSLPPNPSPVSNGCAQCLKSINYCLSATNNNCACYSQAASCFNGAGCDQTSVPLLQAELQCSRSPCSAVSTCNF